MSGKRGCGMKRASVQRIVRANMPRGVWLSAHQILDILMNKRPLKDMGFDQVRNLPPSTQSLSQKIKGMEGLTRRAIYETAYRPTYEYRLEVDA